MIAPALMFTADRENELVRRRYDTLNLTFLSFLELVVAREAREGGELGQRLRAVVELRELGVERLQVEEQSLVCWCGFQGHRSTSLIG